MELFITPDQLTFLNGIVFHLLLLLMTIIRKMLRSVRNNQDSAWNLMSNGSRVSTNFVLENFPYYRSTQWRRNKITSRVFRSETFSHWTVIFPKMNSFRQLFHLNIVLQFIARTTGHFYCNDYDGADGRVMIVIFSFFAAAFYVTLHNMEDVLMVIWE